MSFTTPILGRPPTHHGDQHAETAAGTIQPLAPRPMGAFSVSMKSSNSAKVFTSSPVSPSGERRFYNWADDPSNQTSPDLRLSPKQQPHPDIRADAIDRPWIPEPRTEYATKMQVAHYDFNALVKTEGGEKSPYRPAQISPLDWSAGPSRACLLNPKIFFTILTYFCSNCTLSPTISDSALDASQCALPSDTSASITTCNAKRKDHWIF